MIERFNIPIEWQQVVDYYTELETEKEKKTYIKTFSPEQKKYFLSLIKTTTKDTPVENHYKIKEQDNDEHLLGKKNYIRLKKHIKNQKVLLIASVVVTIVFVAISALQTNLLAQGIAQFSFLQGGVNTESKVLSAQDTQQYNTWVSGYLGQEYQAKTNDADKDGLSNEAEFILQTDPSNADENNDTVLSGLNILNGIDPINGKKIEAINLQKLKGSLSFEEIAMRLAKQSVVKNKADGVETSKIEGAQKLNINGKSEIDIPKLDFISNINWEQNDLGFEKKMLDKNVVHIQNTGQPHEQTTTFLFTTNPILSLENIDKLVGQEDILIHTETNSGKKVIFQYRIVSTNLVTPDGNSFKPSKSSTELALLIPVQQNNETKIQVIKAKLVKIEKVVDGLPDDLLPQQSSSTSSSS